MLISVLNIKVACEWHIAIKQTSKPVALVSENWPLTSNHYTLRTSDPSQGRSELHLAITLECNCGYDEYDVTDRVQYADTKQTLTFRCSIGVLGYIGIVWPKKTLPKLGPFLLGHPVYCTIYIVQYRECYGRDLVLHQDGDIARCNIYNKNGVRKGFKNV